MSSLRTQIFRVFDVETTGLDPRRDAIVEVAFATIRGDGTILAVESSLVNPGMPISAAASRVNRICDADVADAPTIEEVFAGWASLRDPIATGVAHNSAFDLGFLRPYDDVMAGAPKFLCTMRLSRRLLPGVPGYGLGALVSELGLTPDIGDLGLHRARSDVLATCQLLTHLIDRYLSSGRPDDLESFCGLSSITTMPFGKYRGFPLDEVPDDYVSWLFTLEDLDPDLRRALEESRSGNAPSPLAMPRVRPIDL